MKKKTIEDIHWLRLTGNELEAERERLEALLEKGDAVASDANRLVNIRKQIAELEAAKQGSQ